MGPGLCRSDEERCESGLAPIVPYPIRTSEQAGLSTKLDPWQLIHCVQYGARPCSETHVSALSPKAGDHRKFGFALVARDIRRVTALIHRADIDEQQLAMIDAALEQLQARVVWATFIEPAGDVLIEAPRVYSDGRPVTTTIDWGDAFATLVHSPDPAHESSDVKPEGLAEERRPD